ncbi:hypothetical protein AVEN_159934-1 [Araneus ventricosus]|uniref:Uncharacterized protein n=1 Tax=Araneus ventricosus TaxID=182803 RepID=A0A4Y2N4I5_ARAVE|nr:hypothetical protein AVEN_159934-1 [Araneus ventricosus]
MPAVDTPDRNYHPPTGSPTSGQPRSICCRSKKHRVASSFHGGPRPTLEGGRKEKLKGGRTDRSRPRCTSGCEDSSHLRRCALREESHEQDQSMRCRYQPIAVHQGPKMLTTVYGWVAALANMREGLTAPPTTEPNMGRQPPALVFCPALTLVLAEPIRLGHPGTVITLNAKPARDPSLDPLSRPLNGWKLAA